MRSSGCMGVWSASGFPAERPDRRSAFDRCDFEAKRYRRPRDGQSAMITLLGVGHVFDIGAAIRAEVLARRPKVVALELDPARYQTIMSREPRRRGWSLLGLLAQFQVRIANQYGVQVGDEMVAAARAEAELQRFYRDEQSFLREFATELPTAKRILIDERDDVMARTLRQLEESRGGIVAVVGEGHVDGLVRHLVGVPVEVVHLEQLRSPPAGPNASVNVSVHL